MELSKLKKKLVSAQRGHKLLKDKRDELMRRFLEIVRRNRELRARVAQGITEAYSALSRASAVMSTEMLEQALFFPRTSVELDVEYKSIMSVPVPEYSFSTTGGSATEIYPYGFAQTSGELDEALYKLALVFSDMLELAQVEKTMQLLAEEIEKTRRRVNALEYVMIPDMEKNIKYITMKLDENDLSTKIRLMKVKDMVLRQAHDFKT
jgi:V/A-type H+-transporting ATPase subunit D